MMKLCWYEKHLKWLSFDRKQFAAQTACVIEKEKKGKSAGFDKLQVDILKKICGTKVLSNPYLKLTWQIGETPFLTEVLP